jgi:hypothetical protein
MCECARVPQRDAQCATALPIGSIVHAAHDSARGVDILLLLVRRRHELVHERLRRPHATRERFLQIMRDLRDRERTAGVVLTGTKQLLRRGESSREAATSGRQ